MPHIQFDTDPTKSEPDELSAKYDRGARWSLGLVWLGLAVLAGVCAYLLYQLGSPTGIR